MPGAAGAARRTQSGMPPIRDPMPRSSIEEPEALVPERRVEPGAAAILALQRSAGNALVARSLLARLVDPAQEQFRARGFMPTPAGVDFQPSTQGGGFNVLYNPWGQVL